VRVWAIVALVVATSAGCSQSPGSSGPASSNEIGSRTEPAAVADPGVVVGVEEAQLGDPQVDVHGNSVNVHAWMAWPDTIARADPFGTDPLDLVGGLAEGRVAGASIIAIDVEVCASPDQAPGTELLQARFALAEQADGADAAVDDLRSTMIFQPVIDPAFVWPAGGLCQRGWQALEWRGEGAPGTARFTAVSMAEASFGDQWVYHWNFGGQGPVVNTDERITPDTTPGDQALEFTDGLFAGWSVRYLGWNEVPATVGRRDARNRQYFQPREENRLVGVLLEVCAAPDAQESPDSPMIPEIGLRIDGWTLLAPAPAGEVWGPGYDQLGVPNAGSCARGWIPFEVPAAAAPTGVAATDQYLAGRPTAIWRLGEPLPVPETGPGFPNALLGETTQALCGVTEPIVFTLSSDESDEGMEWTPTALVAVRESATRIAIYASEHELRADDVPFPAEPTTTVLQIIVDNGAAAEVIATEYRDDFSNNLYGSINFLDGSLPGRFATFPETTVVVDEITTDYICVTLSNGTEKPGIVGRVGAPLWSPP